MPEAFIDSLIAAAREEYPGEHTYTAGWQQYGYDIYLQARQHRLGHPPQYPDKPYVVSEYGDWEYYAMNAGLNQDLWGDLLEEERSSRQGPGSGEKRLLQQALNIQEAHNDNLNTPAVADGYWVMFDYNRGYADDLEESGIMGIFRIPKYSYHFFRSQRSAGEMVHWKAHEPMVFIASEYSGTSSGDIRIFSNCEEVVLYLNDSILGRQKPDQNRISEFLKHPPFTFKEIPFTPGILTARGVNDGELAAEHSIAAAGAPVEMILEADLSGRPWESGVKDGIFVYARVVDHHKQVIHDFSGQVTFEVSGDAALIGDSSPPVEGGMATALIMAGEEPDEITLKAVSGSLQSAPLIIRTK
jgi:beta-galactosidase